MSSSILMPGHPPPAFPLWFPAYFAGLWLLISAVLGELSGWAALARRYPGGPRPPGMRLRGQVARVGAVAESNVTRMVLTHGGLYLYAHPLFRFRRPPVFLPWNAVHHVSEHKFLRWRSHTLDLAGVTTMRVTDRAYVAVAPYLAGGAPQ